MTDTCAVSGCETEPNGRPYLISEDVALDLCQEHAHDVAQKTKWRAREIVSDLNAIGGITKHTPGWTYVVRLSDGTVKIGLTEAESINERLQGLTTKYNAGTPVAVLAVVAGGKSLEMLYHHQWYHLRIPGAMEAFYQDPSLITWAEGLGIDPHAGLDDFEGYVERRHNRGVASSEQTKELRDLIEQGEWDNWF